VLSALFPFLEKHLNLVKRYDKLQRPTAPKRFQ